MKNKINNKMMHIIHFSFVIIPLLIRIAYSIPEEWLTDDDYANADEIKLESQRLQYHSYSVE